MKKYIKFLLFKNRLREYGISPLDIFFPIVSWIGIFSTIFLIYCLFNILN